MNDTQLLEAQTQREDKILGEEIAQRLDILFSHGDVSPQARAHLHGILMHYAKEAHPFRACVRDNMKRFGPGRTEKICATVKDMIRGTHKWRNTSGVHATNHELNEEIERVLLSVTDEDLDRLVMEASNGR